ncbi:tRNA (N6-threonylcarbamoyladenosine(37)-N6)-methyltransferase TrmO [Ramlibacter sp. G-1-2-2]|uniref:tRNA (N6-threonylcarbamoyladenosine(37)-N6)-methyltransferase TrmO n=1 Tax=Ramlibacter agri TaxID=2728837 RepID=A0A848HDJ4_9BURK|nr:tRNA (N6-threonylcarbamoyladenosine(37)-N6)-methyltransferase TrmO [Ramlibacter agri]NML46613.1 tRNA (N6-threonylcarbamoyladenosine(37)-N6)-methyltransferase TrmO [Ramlibacter agri]
MLAPIPMTPIGVIRSRFVDPAGMPLQPVAAAEEIAQAEIFEPYAAALQDLEGFEYLILLAHMHRATEKLQVVPFLDQVPHGVFATRAPARPNRIGLSVMRVIALEGRVLRFAGNDFADGTPLLDIKPYVPAFDVRATDRIGWYAGRLGALPHTVADDRMGQP